MIQPYFTKQELQDLGFQYQGLTKESTFQYDWWSIEICDVFLDITFEYKPESTDVTTSFLEVNNFEMSKNLSKSDILNFIEFLKKINEK